MRKEEILLSFSKDKAQNEIFFRRLFILNSFPDRKLISYKDLQYPQIELINL